MSKMTDEQFDIDIKNSLDAAFEKEQISVSEDLIASTLAKIRSLDSVHNDKKTSDTQNSGTQASNPQTETPSKTVDVVNLEDRRKKRFAFMKIAGPVAAALIIGIVGLGIIRGGMFSKNSSDKAESAMAPREANSTATSDTKGSESYDSIAFESATNQTASEQADEDMSWTDSLITSLTAEGMDNAGNSEGESAAEAKAEDPVIPVEESPAGVNDADTGSVLQGSYGTDIGETLDASRTGDDTALKDKELDIVKENVTGPTAIYSFRIPEELTDSVRETAEKYTAETVNTDEIDKEYLVISYGTFFYTDNEDLIPDEDDTVYMIEDPEERTDQFAAEVEELVNSEEQE